MRLLVSFYKNVFNFKGSCRFKDYWLTILFLVIAGIILLLIVSGDSSLMYLLTLYFGISILPWLSLNVRRLNDSGKSWRTLLWVFLPIFGWLIIFVALITRSQADKDRDFDRYHW